MGYRHSREEILDAAVAVALERGMASLTFGAVGERLGISDRTVVYYFATKPALVIAVAESLGVTLMTLLDDAFGPEPQSEQDLLRRAWPALSAPEADRIFALYFEMVGLASAGQAPYDALAPAMLGAWVDWLMTRLPSGTPAVRRRRALALVAQVDGLLLLRRVLGAEAADSAARELGAR